MRDLSPVHPPAKRATREHALSARDALSADARAAASRVIAESAAALFVERLPPGAAVGLYAAKGSEVDTLHLDALLRAAGFAVAYPRVQPHDRTLAFHLATHAELLPGRFALREPHADLPVVALAAFAIPGIAFDPHGHRLGWGRGHYDATLSLVPDALRVGLAFGGQLVEQIAHEPHDMRVDYIVTEGAVVRAAD
ncbi:MAG TPA: 5-formyltetrahydrofolate cyclo-ligase [Kofleriaceae bacterium]